MAALLLIENELLRAYALAEGGTAEDVSARRAKNDDAVGVGVGACPPLVTVVIGRYIADPFSCAEASVNKAGSNVAHSTLNAMRDGRVCSEDGKDRKEPLECQ